MAMFIFQPSCFAFASHAAAIFLATSNDRTGRSSNAMAEPASAANSDTRLIESSVFFMDIPLEKVFVKRQARLRRVRNSTPASLMRRLQKVPFHNRPFARCNRSKGREALHERIRIDIGDHKLAMSRPQESLIDGMVEHRHKAVVKS